MSDFDPWEVWQRYNFGSRGRARRPAGYGLEESSRRVPHPDSPAGRSLTWYELAEAEAADWVEEHISALIHGHYTPDLLHVAKVILGADAFGIGFGYGLISHPLHEIAALGELVKVFVLADVHEYFFAPMGAAMRALAPMGPGSVLARRWFAAFRGPSPFRDRTEAAYRQREEILAELKAVMADPVAFFQGMPARLKAEYGPKWARCLALRAQPDSRSQFQAGKIAGELTMEILLLLAGLVAAGATVVKIAGKVPRLLEWARAMRTPKRAAAGTGSSTAALESSAVAPKPAPRPKVAAEPEPPVNRAGTTAAVAKPLPLGGDVTARDIALATSDGAAPEQIAARRKVATQFYDQYGKMPPERSASHVAAIDATKPIKIGPPPSLAKDQYQSRIVGRGTGQYFSDPGVEPTKLGILDRGNIAQDAPVYPRIAERYTVSPDAPYLESTSAPVIDDFSIVGESHPVEGGATQRFIPAASTTPKKVL
jgi:hypothetical protein